MCTPCLKLSLPAYAENEIKNTIPKSKSKEWFTCSNTITKDKYCNKYFMFCSNYELVSLLMLMMVISLFAINHRRWMSDFMTETVDFAITLKIYFISFLNNLFARNNIASITYLMKFVFWFNFKSQHNLTNKFNTFDLSILPRLSW